MSRGTGGLGEAAAGSATSHATEADTGLIASASAAAAAAVDSPGVVLPSPSPSPRTHNVWVGLQHRRRTLPKRYIARFEMWTNRLQWPLEFATDYLRGVTALSRHHLEHQLDERSTVVADEGDRTLFRPASSLPSRQPSRLQQHLSRLRHRTAQAAALRGWSIPGLLARDSPLAPLRRPRRNNRRHSRADGRSNRANRSSSSRRSIGTGGTSRRSKAGFNPFHLLSDEVLLQIFSCLDDPALLCRVSEVCWQFHRVANDDFLWAPLHDNLDLTERLHRDKRSFAVRWRVWRNWKTAKAELVSIGGHNDRITGLTAGEGVVVTCGMDRKLRIWNPLRRVCVHTCRGHTDGIVCLSDVHDGLVASGSLDTSVIVWDVHHGVLVHQLGGHVAPVSAVDLCDGGGLASGGSNGTVYVWRRVQSVAPVRHRLLGHTGCINAVRFDGHDQVISASSDGTLRVWHVASRTARHVIDLDKAILSMHVDFDMSAVAVGTICNRVDGYDLDTGTSLWSLTTGAAAGVVAVHVDARVIVAAADTRLFVWDRSDGVLRAVLAGHRRPIERMSVFPWGVVSVDDHATCMTWDLSDLWPRLAGLTTDSAVQLELPPTATLPHEFVPPDDSGLGNIFVHVALPLLLTAGGDMDRIKAWDLTQPCTSSSKAWVWGKLFQEAVKSKHFQRRDAYFSFSTFFALPLFTLLTILKLDDVLPATWTWGWLIVPYMLWAAVYLVVSTLASDFDSFPGVLASTLTGTTLLVWFIPLLLALRLDDTIALPWTYLAVLFVLSLVLILIGGVVDVVQCWRRGMTWHSDPIYWLLIVLSAVCVVLLSIAGVTLCQRLADPASTALQDVFQPLFLMNRILVATCLITSVLCYRDHLLVLIRLALRRRTPLPHVYLGVAEDFNEVLGTFAAAVLMIVTLTWTFERDLFACLSTASCVFARVFLPIYLLEVGIIASGVVYHFFIRAPSRT